jgi:DNA-binding GntR family transcriptional regulator
MQIVGTAPPPTGDSDQTLADLAYRTLRRDIIRGQRPPGERLRVEKLRQLYDIGATPIREALQKLSTEGLVQATGNRGFTVSPLNPAEFADLNIARTEIELSALRRSIELGQATWEARVVAASYLMAKADAAIVDSGGAVSDFWEETNAAFHTALVSACGSSWLLRVRSGLQDLCERYRRASVGGRRGARELGREHAAIAEATLARDPDRATALLRAHFGKTAEDLALAPARKGA